MMKTNNLNKAAGILVIVFVISLATGHEITRELGNVHVAYENNTGRIIEQELDNGAKKEFFIRPGGELEVKYYDRARQPLGNIRYSDLLELDSSLPRMVFNHEGRIIEASFKVGAEGRFLLGNEELILPKGAEVRFKDNVAEITIPENLEIDKISPRVVAEGEQATTGFVFRTQNNRFRFKNNYVFVGESLKFRNGRYYFDSQDAELEDVVVRNNNRKEVYIDFNGVADLNINGAYISMNRERGMLVAGSNIDEEGPAIRLKPQNAYGIKLDPNDNDHFTIKIYGDSRGEYVWIMNRQNEKKTPYIATLNQFAIDQDKVAIIYRSDQNKLFLSPKKGVVEEFPANEGTTTTPVEINSYYKTTKDSGIKPVSTVNNRLVVGDRNEVGYGDNPWFVVSWTRFFSDKSRHLMKGVSNRWSYYTIETKEDIERFFGNIFKIHDHAGVLTNNPENVRKLLYILGSTPAETLKELDHFTLRTWGSTGLATYSGNTKSVYLNVVASRGISPAVARHELAHIRDFSLGMNFENDWNSIGGPRGPHTYWYGFTINEDTSTFAEYVYSSDELWRYWLSPEFKYHKKFRGRIAVFTKYGFISRYEADRLLSAAGLASDQASLDKYFREAQESFRQIG